MSPREWVGMDLSASPRYGYSLITRGHLLKQLKCSVIFYFSFLSLPFFCFISSVLI